MCSVCTHMGVYNATISTACSALAGKKAAAAAAAPDPCMETPSQSTQINGATAAREAWRWGLSRGECVFLSFVSPESWGVLSRLFPQQLSRWTRPRRSLHKYTLVILGEPGRPLSPLREPELRQKQWFTPEYPHQGGIADDLPCHRMEHDPHRAWVCPFLTPTASPLQP